MRKSYLIDIRKSQYKDLQSTLSKLQNLKYKNRYDISNVSTTNLYIHLMNLVILVLNPGYGRLSVDDVYFSRIVYPYF